MWTPDIIYVINASELPQFFTTLPLSFIILSKQGRPGNKVRPSSPRIYLEASWKPACIQGCLIPIKTPFVLLLLAEVHSTPQRQCPECDVRCHIRCNACPSCCTKFPLSRKKMALGPPRKYPSSLLAQLHKKVLHWCSTSIDITCVLLLHDVKLIAFQKGIFKVLSCNSGTGYRTEHMDILHSNIMSWSHGVEGMVVALLFRFYIFTLD